MARKISHQPLLFLSVQHHGLEIVLVQHDGSRSPEQLFQLVHTELTTSENRRCLIDVGKGVPAEKHPVLFAQHSILREEEIVARKTYHPQCVQVHTGRGTRSKIVEIFNRH